MKEQVKKLNQSDGFVCEPQREGWFWAILFPLATNLNRLRRKREGVEWFWQTGLPSATLEMDDVEGFWKTKNVPKDI